jgi:RimJ/RimL family protein N-acetyltransferase
MKTLPKQRPILKTERLILRPFSIGDASEVQRLAGEEDIAATTLNVPHPYEDGLAEKWIQSHTEAYEKGKMVNFAITLNDKRLIGAISLGITKSHERAELGYWIGKEYWRRGYCTEAAKAVVKFAFDVLGLHKVTAHFLTRNPASGRVMEKIGMKYEGLFREHVRKWGKFEDLKSYGLLKKDYDSWTKK